MHRGNIDLLGTVVQTVLTQLERSASESVGLNDLRAGFGVQPGNLLQGYTALENVLLGMTFSAQKSDKKTARELLSTVGLSRRMNHYPHELSIGEQQRVAIARALSKQPDLILADEPTGSLDPLHAEGVILKLRESSADLGCTLILVSHEQNVVSTFENRVSFLELNRAFACGRGAV